MKFYVRFMFICWLALANILNLTHNGSQGNILRRVKKVEIRSTGATDCKDKYKRFCSERKRLCTSPRYGEWFKKICQKSCNACPVTPQCGEENFGWRGSRISGGSVTRPNQYPWMVRLYMKTKKGYAYGCGGALITSRHVLTAYHCLDDDPVEIIKEETRVKYSVHNQYNDRDYQKVPIKDVKIPKGIPGRDHDIAIVILATPVNLNDKTVGIVCLPANDDEDYRGKSVMAMGWGWTSDKSNEHCDPGELQCQSRLLEHIKLRVGQRKQKNWLFTDVDFGNGKPLDVCHGDSGGPLVYKKDGKWTVIGNVNIGFSCDDHEGTDDGRYARWNKVTDHLTWIKKIMYTT